jgi:hypothetical protein
MILPMKKSPRATDAHGLFRFCGGAGRHVPSWPARHHHECPMPPLTIMREPFTVPTPSLITVFCVIRALPPTAIAV